MAKETIGFIGTGVMGSSMAGHLMEAGYPLNVHNRTRSRADDLLARVIQHELDHLNGVLFIDRIDPKKRERLVKQYETISSS